MITPHTDGETSGVAGGGAVGAGAGWNLAVRRMDGGDLEVVLSGRWCLTEGLPSPASLSGDFSDEVQRVRLSAPDLAAWDSGLPTFLAGLARICDERGIAVDPTGLPDGVQRLLSMAFAIPEQSVAGRAGSGAPSGGRPWRVPAGDRAPGASPSEVAGRAGSGLGLFAQIGTAALDFVRGAPDMMRFLGEIVLSLGRLLSGRARYRKGDLWLEIQEVGPQALPIVSVIAFLIGLILAYLGADQLKQVGAQIFIADLVAIGMVREVGALMTGIIVAGRSGAAFAARLGTMQVNEEIDAFRTLGISPVDFLVLPRLLALMLMMPLLTLYAGFVGMLAGFVVALLIFEIGMFEYYAQTLRALTLTHFWVGLSKGVAYGAVVAFAGCLRGMQCGRSAEAVGEAATSAVVTGILLITIVASVMTIFYYRLGI